MTKLTSLLVLALVLFAGLLSSPAQAADVMTSQTAIAAKPKLACEWSFFMRSNANLQIIAMFFVPFSHDHLLFFSKKKKKSSSEPQDALVGRGLEQRLEQRRLGEQLVVREREREIEKGKKGLELLAHFFFCSPAPPLPPFAKHPRNNGGGSSSSSSSAASSNNNNGGWYGNGGNSAAASSAASSSGGGGGWNPNSSSSAAAAAAASAGGASAASSAAAASGGGGSSSAASSAAAAGK